MFQCAICEASVMYILQKKKREKRNKKEEKKTKNITKKTFKQTNNIISINFSLTEHNLIK